MKSFTKFLLSSIVILNATSLSAMDIGKGVEALGEELGVYGKRVTQSKAPVVATAVAYSPVGSNVFSSSSGGIVGQRAVTVTAAVAADEAGEEQSMVQLLEEEACNNIYLACFAKVANKALAERMSAEGISQETREWAAAEQEAIRDVNKSQQMLEAATDEKKIADKEIKMMLDDRTFHGGSVVAQAYRDFKVKELTEQFAKAKVVTAEATLYAIRVKNTAKSAAAEADLTAAITGEKVALQTREEAKNQVLEQNFASVSIPMAEAVAVEAMAFYPDHHSYEAYHSHQRLSPQNVAVSSERAAQERREALAQKEKAAHEFETTFTETIKEAKTQAEDLAAAATTACEKAEKSGTLKDWNDAIKKATKAEAAHTHLIGYYRMYKEQAAEHYEGGILNAKRSKYNFALQDAEGERDDWTTAAEECKERKESLHHGTAGKAQEEARAAEAKATQEREALELQKKRVEDEANLLAKQKALDQEKEILAREQALAQREAEAARNQEKIKREEAAVLAREREVLEAKKKVEADKEAAAVAQEREAAAAAEKTRAATLAQTQASEQAQQIIIAKKREGEAAFARAKQAKSESGWNEAKTVAMTISNYWNGIVENIKSGRSPLAINQEEAA